MLTNNLLATGGMKQQGGTVDPVSGNTVPVGALKNEVRDDVPAQLSDGEFVFAHAVERLAPDLVQVAVARRPVSGDARNWRPWVAGDAEVRYQHHK